MQARCTWKKHPPTTKLEEGWVEEYYDLSYFLMKKKLQKNLVSADLRNIVAAEVGEQDATIDSAWMGQCFRQNAIIHFH